MPAAINVLKKLYLIKALTLLTTFISSFSYAQPGEHTAVHSYVILTPAGDTMNFNDDTRNSVHFNSTDLTDFSAEVEENIIYISYATGLGALSVNFSILSGNEKMEVETNIKSLTIPFIKGSYKVPSLVEPYLLSDLTISNINWDYFKVNPIFKEAALPQLPMVDKEYPELRLKKFQRVNNELIIGVACGNYDTLHSIFRSEDNGENWQLSKLVFPKENKMQRVQFKELVVQNDSVFYILGEYGIKTKTKVIYSTDSGLSWKEDTTLAAKNPRSLGFAVHSLFFLKDETGIALVEKNYQKKHIYIKKAHSTSWIDQGKLPDTLSGLIGYDAMDRLYLLKYGFYYQNGGKVNNAILYRSADRGLNWKRVDVKDSCRFDVSANTLKILNPRSYELGFQQYDDLICYQFRTHNHFSFRSLTPQKSDYDIILGRHHLCLSRNAGISWKYIPLFNWPIPSTSNLYLETPQDLIILDEKRILLVFKNSLKIGYIDKL